MEDHSLQIKNFYLATFQSSYDNMEIFENVIFFLSYFKISFMFDSTIDFNYLSIFIVISCNINFK